MIKTICTDYGLCCNSCQENVNVHRCSICNLPFDDGDEIYCKNHSHRDCEHYHLSCIEKGAGE
jgi:hypothetical protein